jgi:Holliday junction resolvase
LANPNGRKGAQFETDVMRWLRKMGAVAERLVKAGANDEGDLVATISGKSYILELKNRKTISLPEFWREAIAEAENYAKARGLEVTPPAYIILKRRNSGIEDAWVIQNLDSWLKERQG